MGFGGYVPGTPTTMDGRPTSDSRSQTRGSVTARLVENTRRS